MDKLKELLKKALGDQYTDDIEAQVESAAEEFASSRVDDEVQGLKQKNAELIRTNKRLKQGVDGGEQLDELQGRIDELQTENKRLQKESEKVQKQSAKQLEQLQTQLQSEQGAVASMLVDNGLTEALTQAGVKNPAYVKAAKALLRDKVQVVADGDERKAVVEDKTLSDFVSEWSQGDEGKEFLAHSGSTGGGASGGARDSQSKTITRADFDQMSHTERAAVSKEGIKVVDE